VRPARRWRTLGLSERIRVPSPAARTTARQRLEPLMIPLS
jgi:hypothetical protein